MDSVIVKTPKELASAIKNGADEITIEAAWADKSIKIKVTGKPAWLVCVGALATAIAMFAATPIATAMTAPAGGAGGAAFAVGGTVAIAPVAAILGPAAWTAVAIGVSAGGVGALNTLRDKYTIVEKGKDFVKLKRK